MGKLAQMIGDGEEEALSEAPSPRRQADTRSTADWGVRHPQPAACAAAAHDSN